MSKAKTVNLIDADRIGRVHVGFPNLALMKYSTHYTKMGYKVHLNGGKGDINLVSCVFKRHESRAKAYAKMFDAELGGSGSSSKVVLPEEVEHCCPDYSLYGYGEKDKWYKTSFGFTSRGCSRKCKFCIVPDKEGSIKEWSSLSEFVRHKRVVLLDNNFLASPEWKSKLNQMINRRINVEFNQGLDIRLINKNNAKLLVKLDMDFFRFAFDNIKYLKMVERGVRILREAGVPDNDFHNISFLILCGFDSTFEEDLERVYIVRDKLRCRPFVMPFDRSNNLVMLLSGWANSPAVWDGKHGVKRFEDYLPYKKYLKRKKSDEGLTTNSIFT